MKGQGHDRPSIRSACPSDLEAICAIYNHEVAHGTSTFDLDPWSPLDRGSWLREHLAAGRCLRVVEDGDGRIVAWGKVSAWSPKRGYARTVEASLFVEVEARGRGIGRALLHDLVHVAHCAGHRVLLGRIESTNQASLDLFASMGFETVGVMREVGEKFGRCLDIALVARRLR